MARATATATASPASETTRASFPLSFETALSASTVTRKLLVTARPMIADPCGGRVPVW
jgi:hypothetical protein